MTSRKEADLIALRARLRALVKEWRRRADAAQHGGMINVATEYNDCADELMLVIKGR
jgi:hypothetical protein